MSNDVQTGNLVLVYGGSFDPPHRAHTQLPIEAAHAIGADKIIYVPAGRPPHKSGYKITDGSYRLRMLQMALTDHPDHLICDWELQRDEPSYTAHTLEHLHHQFGSNVRMRLLIGADMASIFYNWYRPDLILELAEPLVMLRPPQTDADVLGALPNHLSDSEQQDWQQRIVSLSSIDVSSTHLRKLLATGQDDDAYVTSNLSPDVLTYIRENNLYRETE